MKLDSFVVLVLFLSVVFADPSYVFSQSNGTGSLRGTVRGPDGTPLPGANVLVAGTSNGTPTDLDGNYFIHGISAGRQKVVFSYVGYEKKIVEVEIKEGVVTQLNVTLQATGVTSEPVVVTAQMSGQQAAINLQLQSTSIANVVAADRLQANPDQNLAEAIGRLPGISLIRAGGEGVGVVVRGLQPGYSQIMINSVPVSVSLAGITQYDIKSVEVFKTITPEIHDIGFLMRGEILWDKGSSASPSTAWGTYLKANSPVLWRVASLPAK
jgi:hypothetical protein